MSRMDTGSHFCLPDLKEKIHHGSHPASPLILNGNLLWRRMFPVLVLAAVLSQRHGNPPKLYPCAFHSHKLTPTEQNYDVGNRELLAMKAIFEEWHHWLEGAKHPFTVLTDHRNLEYLKSAKRLNHRQARWSFFFTHFDLLRHISQACSTPRLTPCPDYTNHPYYHSPTNQLFPLPLF